MKRKYTLITLLCLCFSSPFYAQTTTIPDSNFEQALIDAGYDTGTPDGVVLTANIETVTSLDVSGKSITNLTGIEDFTALEVLSCSLNDLTNINVTNNKKLKELYCANNELTSLDVSENTALENLHCYVNKINALDLTKNKNLIQIEYSFNPNLTSLDVSENTKLKYLYGHHNENITHLDVSMLTGLKELDCYNGGLQTLNIQNGQNSEITFFDVSDSPDLTCVQVDDVAYSGIQWSSGIDDVSYFQLDCGLLGVADVDDEIFNMYPVPAKDYLKLTLKTKADYTITNLQGKTVLQDNLTRGEHTVNVSGLSSGLFFVKVTDRNSSTVKKLVVK